MGVVCSVCVCVLCVRVYRVSCVGGVFVCMGVVCFMMFVCCVVCVLVVCYVFLYCVCVC